MKKIFGLMTMVFAIGMFIACDNGTTSGDGNNNNNNNQNALNIAALTTWVNNPARTMSLGGLPAGPINSGHRNAFLAAAPELWNPATSQNNEAYFRQLFIRWGQSVGLSAPIVITKGKQFDASAISAIAVKNPLGAYMRGRDKQRAA